MPDIPMGYDFRVDTNKGRFYAYIEGEDVHQAEQVLRAWFQNANAGFRPAVAVAVLGIKALKVGHGSSEQALTMYSYEGKWSHLAGRLVWEAFDQGNRYDDQMKQQLAEFDARLRSGMKHRRGPSRKTF